MKQSILTIIISGFLLFSCGNESKPNIPVSEKLNIVKNENPEEVEISGLEAEDSTNISPDLDQVVDLVSSELPKEEIADTENYTLPMITIPIEENIEMEEVVSLKPDHVIWNRLLKKNVSSNGSVNYVNMKNSIDEINTYIKQLENLTDQAKWSRNEKLAYWINLYNAATVRLIVENYPVKSITDINGGKPWDEKIVTVGNNTYSLNQIENDIIRPKFNEPRIHFAVNCAAKSCPKLMNSAFIPSTLNSQLTMQAKSFINSSKNDITTNKIAISKIFEWYKDDFGASIIDYLNKYSTVKINPETTVDYKEYNWDLNK